MNIISSLIFGFISGLAEFFPVSASAHQQLFYLFTGQEKAPAWHLAEHLGCLTAIFVVFFSRIRHTLREVRIASGLGVKRQADPTAISEWQLMLTSVLPIFVGLLLLTRIECYQGRFWFLALAMILNGIVIYVAQFIHGENKDSRGLSRLDGLIIGLSGALGIFPGISRVSTVILGGKLRGADTAYITDFALLQGIFWLLGILVLDTVAVVLAPVSMSLLTFISLLFCAVAAFGGSYAAISLLRFLAVRIGFTGFSLYNWGFGLVCFVLYLMI